MLKTRQRRPGTVVLPNCEDLKPEFVRALVHNEMSMNVSGIVLCVLFFPLAVRLKFISRSKMAATSSRMQGDVMTLSVGSLGGSGGGISVPGQSAFLNHEPELFFYQTTP